MKMNGKAEPEAASFLLFLEVSFPVKLCDVPFPGFFDAGISEKLSGPSLSGTFSRLSIKQRKSAIPTWLCVRLKALALAWLEPLGPAEESA
jgi:hypothetical protein